MSYKKIRDEVCIKSDELDKLMKRSSILFSAIMLLIIFFKLNSLYIVWLGIPFLLYCFYKVKKIKFEQPCKKCKYDLYSTILEQGKNSEQCTCPACGTKVI